MKPHRPTWQTTTNMKTRPGSPKLLKPTYPEHAQPTNTVLTAHTPFNLTYTNMFSSNRTPTPIRKPASPASENEVENALVSTTTQGKIAKTIPRQPTSSTDLDTEMLDAHRKNPLSRAQEESVNSASQPPKKRLSSSNPNGNLLPTHNYKSNDNYRGKLPTTGDQTPPPAGTNQNPAHEPQTQPPQTRQVPPPTPTREILNQPPGTLRQPMPWQTPALLQQPQPREQRTQQPPPGFTSAEEREEMRWFATEQTQALSRQAAARLATTSDDLETTPIPEQGFYCPEGLLGHWTIDNIKAAQVITITTQLGASVVIHIEGETSHDPNHAPHLAAGLAWELKRILPLKNPQVVPGIPATPPAKASDAPYTYFVHGLTSDAYVKLTAQGTWRTRSTYTLLHIQQWESTALLSEIHPRHV